MGVAIDASRQGPRASWKASAEAVWDSFYEGFKRSIVDTSIWVSAGLASLTLFTQHVLELPFDLRPFLLVLFSGIAIYNLDHVNDQRSRSMPDETAEEFFSSFPLLTLMASAFVATGLMVSVAPAAAKTAFGLYLAIGLSYSVHLIPSRKPGRMRLDELWQHRGLRAKARFVLDRFHFTQPKQIPGAKAWLVAFAMTTGAVALPLGWVGISLGSLSLTSPAWMLFFFVFAFCSCNTHAFDVRDKEEDLAKPVAKQVFTMATLIELKELKRALSLLLLSVLLVLSVGEKLGWFQGLTLTHPEILIAGAVALLYVQLLRDDLKADVFNIWIEATFFVPALVAVTHSALH